MKHHYFCVNWDAQNREVVGEGEEVSLDVPLLSSLVTAVVLVVVKSKRVTSLWPYCWTLMSCPS